MIKTAVIKNIRKKFSLLRFFPILFPNIIRELENSSNLLEKEYSKLKKKEEQNTKLYNQLKKLNISLKQELKNKELELKELYRQMSIKEMKKHQDEIQRIERKIAGGFAHKMKNLYEPIVLLNDKIERNNLLKQNKTLLFEIFNIFKKELSNEDMLQVIPGFEKINENQKKMDEIFKLSNAAIVKNIKLINEFLNYSELKPSKVMVDIEKVIDAVVADNRDLLKHEKIILERKLNYKKKFLGSYEHFTIVINNLVKNAVKSLRNKPQKDRKIIIKTYLPSAGAGECVIEVVDNGIGIPESNLSKIFNPFFTTDKKEGTGIGLALCKKILELYNSSITVENNIETGVTFKIIIPIRGE